MRMILASWRKFKVFLASFSDFFSNLVIRFLNSLFLKGMFLFFVVIFTVRDLENARLFSEFSEQQYEVIRVFNANIEISKHNCIVIESEFSKIKKRVERMENKQKNWIMVSKELAPDVREPYSVARSEKRNGWYILDDSKVAVMFVPDNAFYKDGVVRWELPRVTHGPKGRIVTPPFWKGDSKKLEIKK